MSFDERFNFVGKLERESLSAKIMLKSMVVKGPKWIHPNAEALQRFVRTAVTSNEAPLFFSLPCKASCPTKKRTQVPAIISKTGPCWLLWRGIWWLVNLPRYSTSPWNKALFRSYWLWVLLIMTCINPCFFPLSISRIFIWKNTCGNPLKKHPLNFCFVSSLIQKKPRWVIFSPSHRVRIILRGELEILHRCLWRVPFNPRLETRPWQITSVDDSEIFNLKNWPIFTYIYYIYIHITSCMIIYYIFYRRIIPYYRINYESVVNPARELV